MRRSHYFMYFVQSYLSYMLLVVVFFAEMRFLIEKGIVISVFLFVCFLNGCTQPSHPIHRLTGIRINLGSSILPKNTHTSTLGREELEDTYLSIANVPL